jgi:hypothetical protein
VGWELGRFVGGLVVGAELGRPLEIVGVAVVGAEVGVAVGISVGTPVGTLVGIPVALVGVDVVEVGALVGVYAVGILVVGGPLG